METKAESNPVLDVLLAIWRIILEILDFLF